uniref:uncharacterized protein C15orf39 homolog n=1 Tax=Pristiophorus japonicus TaxID=55135 RepID=UPI00398F8C2A
MMANKRNLDRMDSLICSKIPRLENDPIGLSAGLCKPSPLPSYTHENPLKYTGSYLAYHLRNQDGTNLPVVWSQPRPYLQHMGNPTIQSQPSDASRLTSHLYQTEPEILSPAFQPSVNEKDKLDLVKDLMNVRSKWVTFVERQKSLRNGQNLPSVLCSSAVGKHNLMSPSCVNVAFPQPVYRNSVCCSGAGCSLENNSVDHFRRRGQETEWRMPPPVTSSCLVANNSQLMHNQQYGNPLLKNKSLHHESGNMQNGSVGRIAKEASRLPAMRSPLCQGYGPYNRNDLQDPRYSALSYENSNGNVPSHVNTPIHNLQEFQKVHPFAAPEGQQMQPPLYHDKLSPPKFPMPIQPKAIHSQNTISNQPNSGTYSLLPPPSYKAQVGACQYPVPGAGGRMPISNSTFAGQLSPGNPYPQPSESLGYPTRPQLSLQKSVSMTDPLFHPASQPTEFESQSPSRKQVSAPHQDLAHVKLPSPDMLQFRPSVVVDAQSDERGYNSLKSLYNQKYGGQQQLISKHSAFHPVRSGKHLKGTFAGSPADQRPKDIYMQEPIPNIHVSSNSDHGRSVFSKENENINKPVDGRLENSPSSYNISPTRKSTPKNYNISPTRKSTPKNYNISPTRRSPPKSYIISPTSQTSEIHFSPASPPASKVDKRATPPASPPMPVINNVFSLAPYKAYLEATGLFFSKCLKCQSDCDESLICLCSSENRTKNCSYAAVELDKHSPIRLPKAISELQSRDGELEKNNPSACFEPTNEKCTSGKEVFELDPNKHSPSRLSKVISELQAKKAELKKSYPPLCVESANEKGASEQDELNKIVSEKNSLDFQHQDINLSSNHSRQSHNCNTNCAGDHVDGKFGMDKMDADIALDLRINNKTQLVDATQQTVPVSCGLQEELKSTKETLNEKEGNHAESLSNAEKRESKGLSGEHGGKKTIVTTSIETNNMSNYHRLEMNKYKILRPAPPKAGETNPIQPSESITEINKFTSITRVDPLTLILRPLKLILPDVPKSMLSPVPEAKNPLCETWVSVPSNGQLTQSDTDTYGYFVHLHQSLCDMIAQSVAETSEEVLRVCMQDIEVQNDGKENPKLRSSLKSKYGSRNCEVLKMSKSREIWRNYGQVQSTMQKVLSRLETYLFTRACPFPHVIRAGAIFIPIYLVKEKLFSSLKGAMIDQVFQKHKIELRPTTLSEEKKLQSELQLQRCSSRLIKLLSLKQLPEIYQDLLNVLWHSRVKIRLGEQNDENMKETTITPNPADWSGNKNPQTHPSPTGETQTQNQTTAANTSYSEVKPDNGNAVVKPDIKLRKRRRKNKATPPSVNSDPVCTNSSDSSQSANKVKPSSVVHSEKTSCTEPVQEARTVQADKEPQPGPRKLRKRLQGLKMQGLRMKGLLEEKAFNKGNFEKKGSTLVVRLNRVAVNEDNKGIDVSHTVKIKDSQMPIKKKSNGALRPTRSTSKVLHLRGSIVRLKFQKPVQTAPCRNIVLKPIMSTRKPPSLTHARRRLDQKIIKPLRFRKCQGKEYPNLVGKRIRHLYEENDKSESWYKGVVVRVHEMHQNPLETVYEVKYDTEPDWQYYLELLQDYEKGWLRVDD